MPQYVHRKKEKTNIIFISSECIKGSYGIGCNETCGHCRDENQCSHINSNCLTNCEVGFKGIVCTTGKENKQVQADNQTPSIFFSSHLVI